MFRNLTLLAGGLVLLSAASLRADDAVLAQMYGSGVHAYFSRDYVKAYQYLTSAIDAGTTDPRCYYFRGLAYMRLGREPEAEMDFAKGAELESRDVDRFYNVARSLERIQGRTRLLLERYRVKARLAALKRAEEVRRARYEATRAEEGRVLHPPIETSPGPPPALSPQPGVQPVPEPIPSDIFEPSPPSPQKAVEPSPQKPGEQSPPSPFESSPSGQTKVTEPVPGSGGQIRPGGLFSALRRAVGKAITGGGGTPATIETPAGDQTRPVSEDQLKGVPEGAAPGPGLPEGGDNPFQGEPSPRPPAKPPAKPPAEVPGDPFADQPAPTPPEPPAEPVPEPPSDNPFAE